MLCLWVSLSHWQEVQQKFLSWVCLVVGFLIRLKFQQRRKKPPVYSWSHMAPTGWITGAANPKQLVKDCFAKFLYCRFFVKLVFLFILYIYSCVHACMGACLCVCMFMCVPVCVCMCACMWRGQKRALDVLKLGFHRVLRCPTWVLGTEF